MYICLALITQLQPHDAAQQGYLSTMMYLSATSATVKAGVLLGKVS